MASVVKHRFKRKSLKKPDEFLTISQKAVDFFIAHSRVFLIAIACVLLAALTAAGINYYRANKIREASGAFASALRLYEQKQYSRAVAAFQEIADTRWTGPYRELSILYKANSQMRLNATAGALKTLDPILSSKNSFVKALAFKLKGDAQAALGQTNEAATSYQQAVSLNGPLQAESLLLQARQLERNGKPTDAAALYEKFLQSFPESSERPVVEARLKSIKGD